MRPAEEIDKRPRGVGHRGRARASSPPYPLRRLSAGRATPDRSIKRVVRRKVVRRLLAKDRPGPCRHRNRPSCNARRDRRENGCHFRQSPFPQSERELRGLLGTRALTRRTRHCRATYYVASGLPSTSFPLRCLRDVSDEPARGKSGRPSAMTTGLRPSAPLLHQQNRKRDSVLDRDGRRVCSNSARDVAGKKNESSCRSKCARSQISRLCPPALFAVPLALNPASCAQSGFLTAD
jgi:hypothetical protein